MASPLPSPPQWIYPRYCVEFTHATMALLFGVLLRVLYAFCKVILEASCPPLCFRPRLSPLVYVIPLYHPRCVHRGVLYFPHPSTHLWVSPTPPFRWCSTALIVFLSFLATVFTMDPHRIILLPSPSHCQFVIIPSTVFVLHSPSSYFALICNVYPPFPPFSCSTGHDAIDKDDYPLISPSPRVCTRLHDPHRHPPPSFVAMAVSSSVPIDPFRSCFHPPASVRIPPPHTVVRMCFFLKFRLLVFCSFLSPSLISIYHAHSPSALYMHTVYTMPTLHDPKMSIRVSFVNILIRFRGVI